MYWQDYVTLMLPGLLSMLASAVPLALGLALCLFHLLRRNAGPYVRNLWGSTAAGLTAVVMLWGSLFGSDLRSSSTAGLVFLFVPIYSVIALGAGYGFGALAYRRSPWPIGPATVRFVAAPAAMLAVLLFGIFREAIDHNDLIVAERATNPGTLHTVYEQSLRGDADAFGVPLFLGQNPNTPGDILAALAKHDHVSVRTFVARHVNTPVSALELMATDCDELVRKTVAERLKQPVRPAPTCTTRQERTRPTR